MSTSTEEVARAVYTFEVPKGLAASTKITSLGLVELTGHEEVLAAKRTQQEPMRLAFELARESLKNLNGKPATDMQLEEFWNVPLYVKLRQLTVQAFHKVNQSEPEETRSFLKSMTITVD